MRSSLTEEPPHPYSPPRSHFPYRDGYNNDHHYSDRLEYDWRDYAPPRHDPYRDEHYDYHARAEGSRSPSFITEMGHLYRVELIVKEESFQVVKVMEMETIYRRRGSLSTASEFKSFSNASENQKEGK